MGESTYISVAGDFDVDIHHVCDLSGSPAESKLCVELKAVLDGFLRWFKLPRQCCQLIPASIFQQTSLRQLFPLLSRAKFYTKWIKIIARDNEENSLELTFWALLLRRVRLDFWLASLAEGTQKVMYIYFWGNTQLSNTRFFVTKKISKAGGQSIACQLLNTTFSPYDQYTEYRSFEAFFCNIFIENWFVTEK